MSKYKHGSLACNGNGQKALVVVNSGEWTWMVWCLAIWSEKMITCANVNNEGGSLPSCWSESDMAHLF